MPNDPGQFGPTLASLVALAPLNELGPGRPQAALRERLASLSPEAVVAPHELRDPEMARACLAGLWLRFDFLDESHRLSQEIETPTGSYWHGIMHRREPDFGNAKYWFRRVGRHAVFEPLCDAARQLAAASDAGGSAGALVRQTAWDASGFVDLCEEAIQPSSPLEPLCRAIQRREWELLFEHCYAKAIGR